MRRTKIVATVGPASESPEMLLQLAQAGVDVFRLNFSHGTHAWHGAVIDRIRKLNTKLDQHRAIMFDTKGPSIRTGDLRIPLKLRKGKKLILTVDHLSDFEKHGKVSVNYDEFIHDVSVGDRILVDNGRMTLRVAEIKGLDVICEILDGGELTSRRHLNLPGKEVSMDSITEKDWDDIRFAIQKKVDFIALSFVRSAKEIEIVKKFLTDKKSNIDVIAKIETLEATKRLAPIFEAADGVMVARGDLGAEIPFTQVPLLQWEIAQMAARYGKPTIVATQMLESMTSSPMPTRAEVSDVFAATWQRNDAVMLSGETASGAFPLKSVEAMRDIAVETENAYLKKRSIRKVEPDGERSAFCKNAGIAAEDLPDIAAIVVVTHSGRMARMMANFRPAVPIFAVTNNSETRQKLQLIWGTRPFEIDFSRDPEKTIRRAVEMLTKQIVNLKGKKFVLLSDILVGSEFEPALQIREF